MSLATFFVAAAWTLQQLREAISYEDGHRYLIHDRDSIFAENLDESIGKLAMQVLKSPPRSPKANAICERVIGTIRRECLDWLILLSEPHLRSILKEWVTHYNRGRPHMSLGPGVPDPLHGSYSSEISTSHWRRAFALRQIGAGRIASRVFIGADTDVIEYVRTTGLRMCVPTNKR